jgi:hypothetical protein
MSTINPSESRQVLFPTATSLLAVKQRRRVQHLLYTRKRLAQLAAEQRAHGLDDAVELYSLQLEVEQAIFEDFPEVFDQVVWQWAEEEATAEHHPAVTADSCSLCKAIARSRESDPGAPLAA